MKNINVIKVVMFLLVSLGLLISLGLIMTRPMSPSIEGLQVTLKDTSYTAFLIETVLTTILVALVTAFINYFLFKKTAMKLIKRKPLVVLILAHIIVALIGSIGYIKTVAENVY